MKFCIIKQLNSKRNCLACLKKEQHQNTLHACVCARLHSVWLRDAQHQVPALRLKVYRRAITQSLSVMSSQPDRRGRMRVVSETKWRGTNWAFILGKKTKQVAFYICFGVFRREIYKIFKS